MTSTGLAEFLEPPPREGARTDPLLVQRVVAKLSRNDFARLLAFRTDLRRFERWSERQARAVGLSPAQHQLMLAVKGHDDRRGPTVGEIADYLGVDVRTVYRMAELRRAPIFVRLVKGQLYADPGVIDAWLAAEASGKPFVPSAPAPDEDDSN